MNLIPLPYRILGAVVLAIALLGAGYWKGHHDGTAAGQIKIDAVVADAQAAKDAEATQANTAATKLETGNAQARIIYKTITQTVDRIVERPVYSGACLDDDGLRAVNEALAGESPITPRPADAVSRALAPH